MPRLRWIDGLFLLTFGLASSAWCVTAATKLGPTFDEPPHLHFGLTSWRTGSNKLMMTNGCMPLPVDVQTLPIYLWERARGEPFQEYRDIETILPVARATNLVFWWTLLVYAMLLGRAFDGPWGGRLAVGLIACEPNLLGHACLATTDISIVAAMLALVYHMYRGQGRGWGLRVLVPGLLYGTAVLAKASGMVFGVQAMLVIGLCHQYGTGALTPPMGSSLVGKVMHLWHATFQLRKDLVWIGLIGFTLVFAYTGSDWGVEGSFVEWAEKLPEGTLRSTMVPVSHDLKIFPNAGEALIQQIKHNMRGHGTFLLGQYYDRATLEYFPIALTIKTPVPVIALLLTVLLIRPRALATPLMGIVLVLFAFSLNCRVQIGIRFMFTLMAILNITLAVAIARTWSEPGNGRYVPRWFVAGMLTAMAGVSVWIWPHGLSYVNQLWGGVQDGYRHLSDSNYDWGQGLPDLKEWNRANNNGERIALCYFGTDPAILDPQFKPLSFFHMLKTGTPEELRRVAGTRYLAMSTTALYGSETSNPGMTAALKYLRSLPPVGRTHTFFIFDLQQ